MLSGLITRSQSGFYTVQTESGPLVCQLRGRLKQGAREGDIAAIGDRVQVTRIDQKTGVIEAIEPRARMISRLAPTPRGEYRQVIIANPDQIVYVFACAEPEPNTRMLDRFLVTAEEQAIPPLIVANKVDLVAIQSAQELFERYEKIGYPVRYTSAKTGFGIDGLREELTGKISALAGPSGAGKSSLLNALQPGLGLDVKAISEATGKGTHATVVSELFPLKDGGYVADTPGLKALALWDIEPEELDGYFPEIRALVSECRFSDCSHLHEPGCAVRAAVEQGEIHPARYQSYARMRLGAEEKE